MVFKVELLPAALADLNKINEYYVEDTAAGDKVFERINKGLKQLEVFPFSGTEYNDLEFRDIDLRRLIVDKDYKVFYEVKNDTVVIHRVKPSKSIK